MSGTSAPYDGTGLRKDRPRNSGGQGGDTFKVADHNIDEVKDFVEEHPDQVEAVLAAERKGEKRKTLVEWLESKKDDSGLL